MIISGSLRWPDLFIWMLGLTTSNETIHAEGNWTSLTLKDESFQRLTRKSKIIEVK